jgi:hypothetical protein
LGKKNKENEVVCNLLSMKSEGNQEVIESVCLGLSREVY